MGRFSWGRAGDPSSKIMEEMKSPILDAAVKEEEDPALAGWHPLAHVFVERIIKKKKRD